MYVERNGEKESGELMNNIQLMTRDNDGTPVQWDVSANGGFPSGNLWMRVSVNYKEINSASQVTSQTRCATSTKRPGRSKRNTRASLFMESSTCWNLTDRRP